MSYLLAMQMSWNAVASADDDDDDDDDDDTTVEVRNKENSDGVITDWEIPDFEMSVSAELDMSYAEAKDKVKNGLAGLLKKYPFIATAKVMAQVPDVEMPGHGMNGHTGHTMSRHGGHSMGSEMSKVETKHNRFVKIRFAKQNILPESLFMIKQNLKDCSKSKEEYCYGDGLTMTITGPIRVYGPKLIRISPNEINPNDLLSSVELTIKVDPGSYDDHDESDISITLDLKNDRYNNFLQGLVYKKVIKTIPSKSNIRKAFQTVTKQAIKSFFVK